MNLPSPSAILCSANEYVEVSKNTNGSRNPERKTTMIDLRKLFILGTLGFALVLAAGFGMAKADESVCDPEKGTISSLAADLEKAAPGKLYIRLDLDENNTKAFVAVLADNIQKKVDFSKARKTSIISTNGVIMLVFLYDENGCYLNSGQLPLPLFSQIIRDAAVPGLAKEDWVAVNGQNG